jgi:electron transport complex protein RnfB
VLESCTGCELCIAPCPVDCIVMVPRAQLPDAPHAPSAADNRARFRTHDARLAAQQAATAALLSDRKRAARSPARE